MLFFLWAIGCRHSTLINKNCSYYYYYYYYYYVTDNSKEIISIHSYHSWCKLQRNCKTHCVWLHSLVEEVIFPALSQICIYNSLCQAGAITFFRHFFWSDFSSYCLSPLLFFYHNLACTRRCRFTFLTHFDTAKCRYTRLKWSLWRKHWALSNLAVYGEHLASQPCSVLWFLHIFSSILACIQPNCVKPKMRSI